MPKKIEVQNVAPYLDILYKRAKDSRSETSKKWKTHYDWFLGHQQQQDKPAWKANSVTNFLFSQVWGMVPILTRRMPEVSFKPIIDGMDVYNVYAEWLTQEVNRVFHRNNFGVKQATHVLMAVLFGPAYYKPVWDRSMYGGRGGVKISVPDTRSVYKEPGKAHINDCNYVFESTAVDRLSLYRQYPDAKDKINHLFQRAHRSDEVGSSEIKAPDDSGHQVGEAGVEDTTSVSYIWETAKMGGDQAKQRIELVEAWVFDEETLGEIPDIVDNVKNVKGENKKPLKDKPSRRRYPDGRLVQFAGQEAFLDKPNPFPEYPYIEFANYSIPGLPDSMGELEQGLPIQEQYNIRQNQIFDICNHSLNRRTFFGAGSGIDTSLLTNRPGENMKGRDVGQIKVVDAPNIPGGLFDSLFWLKKSLETVMGFEEVMRGQVPGDIRSGAGIDALQEAAQTRLQLKSDAMESTVKELAKFVVKLIGRFYVYGQHYYDFVPISQPDSPPLKLEFRDDNGKVLLNPDMFDIEVKAGANVSTSRYLQEERVWRALNEGVVDERYVVENLQFEGRDALIQRMSPQWQARKEQMSEEEIAQTLAQGGTR